MGYYLNSTDALELYKGESEKPYYVDKTGMLNEMIFLLEHGRNYIAVTRPRRFGKSVVAAMIGAYFGKGADGSDVFASFQISNNENYKKHLNQHDLIYIDFSRNVEECRSYDEYIGTIKMRLFNDLKEVYPDVKINPDDSIGASLKIVSMANNNQKFILVFDEWDYVFHRNYFTEEDRGRFTAFLGGMTKGMPYVSLAYLTGVRPIKKYSVSDTMNHFWEFNMVDNDMYGEYFGFTDAEVDDLYRRYIQNCSRPSFSREDLKQWYDGYHMENGLCLYNPNSIVLAFTQNRIRDYWAKAGEYEELKDYVLNNIDGVREAVMLLAAGESVEVDISEYATSASELEYRDEILSVMVIYGYLNYSDGRVRIPNKELELEFDKIIRKEPRYSYMRELEKESRKILQATLDGDAETVGNVLAIVHTTESPLKAYNDEAELSGSVKLAYIAARNQYDMEREDLPRHAGERSSGAFHRKAGIGYVDYIFYPHNRTDDGIIIELKVDDTPEKALQQIKDKNYALKFQGKMGEQPRTTGRIILVGIGYYRKDKVHKCKIEVLG